MKQQDFRTARKRYFKAFAPLMALYLVILMAGRFYLTSLDHEPLWLQVMIAVGASLPLVGVMFVIIRYAEETDEFLRITLYRSMAIAGAITVSFILIVGFLEMFDAIEPVGVFWFGPFYLVTYGLIYRFTGGTDCL